MSDSATVVYQATLSFFEQIEPIRNRVYEMTKYEGLCNEFREFVREAESEEDCTDEKFATEFWDVFFGDAADGIWNHKFLSKLLQRLSKSLRKAGFDVGDLQTLGPQQESIGSLTPVEQDLNLRLFYAFVGFWKPANDGSLESPESAARKISVGSRIDEDEFLPGALQWELKEQTESEWIACVPMERLFSTFPAFTDFGKFQIVNPRYGQTGSHRSDKADLKRLLGEHLGVDFHDSPDLETAFEKHIDSTATLTQAYIPGRAQLVFGIGQGHAKRRLTPCRDQLASILPYIRYAQFLHETLDMNDEFPVDRLWNREQEARFPNQTLMSHRLVEIPAVALLVKSKNGECFGPFEVFDDRRESYVDIDRILEESDDTESVRPYDVFEGYLEHWTFNETPRAEIGRTFECWEGEGYEQPAFLERWNMSIAPLIQNIAALHKFSKGGRFIKSTQRAMTLVGSSLRRSPQEKLLNLIVACETVLNPFGNRSDLAERFRLWISCLHGGSAEVRRANYIRAKHLYKIRCEAVHTSSLPGKISDDLRRFAATTLTTAMLAMTKWSVEHLEQNNGKLDDKDFEEKFLETLFHE